MVLISDYIYYRQWIIRFYKKGYLHSSLYMLKVNYVDISCSLLVHKLKLATCHMILKISMHIQLQMWLCS